MRHLRYSVLISLLFVCIPVWAQQSATANPTAQSVLQKSLAALVGTAAVTDVTLAGTVRHVAGPDDETGSITLKALVAGEARMDFSFGSGQRSEIRATSEGAPAGNWTEPSGTVHELSPHNCWTDATWFFPAFLSAYGGSSNTLVQYVGPVTHEGISVLHLRSTKIVPGDLAGNPSAFVAQLSEMEIYLDPQSLLPVAVTFNTHPDGNASSDIPVEIRYSSYQNVNGSEIPFHIQEYIQYGLILDINVASATFNTGLTSADFLIQ